MRICIVAEGCYPYVVGGVSSWIHSMIKIFPEYQFVVLAIVANRSLRGKFVYDLTADPMFHQIFSVCRSTISGGCRLAAKRT